MGLPFWLFASAVFLARIVRFTIIALLGDQASVPCNL
jgi:membrane protein YqaA with SNARE-associated domain